MVNKEKSIELSNFIARNEDEMEYEIILRQMSEIINSRKAENYIDRIFISEKLPKDASIDRLIKVASTDISFTTNKQTKEIDLSKPRIVEDVGVETVGKLVQSRGYIVNFNAVDPITINSSGDHYSYTTVNIAEATINLPGLPTSVRTLFSIRNILLTFMSVTLAISEKETHAFLDFSANACGDLIDPIVGLYER